MASLFDQYEQAATKSSSSNQRLAMPQPINTGFVSTRIEDDTPIFNKQRINFSPRDNVTHLCVCNNYLVMAMTTNVLLRIDLEHPESPDEVEMPKSVDDRIIKVFLDPTGRHLLVSMASGDNYYLSRNSKKPKQINRMKGHQISAVGWNRHNTSETTTAAFLIGTSKGLIFETEIVSNEDSRFFQGNLEQYVKQLFNIGKYRACPVTGLAFDKLPSTSLTEYRYFVMATTPGRLYQFIGNIPTSTEPPMFQHIFAAYEDKPERFLELPGNFGYSELCFHHRKFHELPRTFAWMTGPGVYYGNIDVTGASSTDSITTDTKLIQYSAEDTNQGNHPSAVVLTEFHVLVLFHDRLRASCVLNEQMVYEDVYSDRFGQLKGLCQDPVKGTIWAYTARTVFKYKVFRESRDVWQMYLDKGQFALAKQYCQDNPVNMDKVLTREADHHFQKTEYQKSAELYAKTQNSFEEIALKYISVNQSEALKTFLTSKLLDLKPNEKMQMTMIVTWLIELYLNSLGRLKEQGQHSDQEYEKLHEEFRVFLATPKIKECVNFNRSTVYDLIASHGDVEDMVFFAVLMHDFERVVSHYLQHENYSRALQMLSKQADVELIYKFSPVLMQNIPAETVDVWISRSKLMDPKRLIPALVQYDHQKYATQDNEAIRYLEFCTQTLDISDTAIHNYLLALYARLEPEKLLSYLALQGQDPELVCYDLKYALRLCSEYGHKKACVHIYTTMGLYEEAVDLALEVDVELAKQNADRPEDDEELRRKLWLRIARHVVEEKRDIKRAMEFLHECDLLNIEDILPFFPDFVTIDHFKDAIITSLQEYTQHIESLKEEMDEATESAQDIRAEIHAFRNKYMCVKSQDRCSICNFPLMTRGFYVFPCMHRFHRDCLIAEVVPHLSNARRIRVDDLQRQLASHEDTSGHLSASAKNSSSKQYQEVKDELDELVAGECIYCGDLMIRLIDKPFIDPEESSQMMEGWL